MTEFTADGELLDPLRRRSNRQHPHVLRSLMWEHHHFDPGSDATWDAIRQLCLATSATRSPPISPRSRGTEPNVSTSGWPTYLGAPSTTLNDAIGKIVLVAMVRPAREPGCKFDQIIVLEGPEGTEKSTCPGEAGGKQGKF